MYSPSVLILLSIATEPHHGYAIQQEIEKRTGQRPGPGTLYGAIARLEEGGLIAAVATNERRRPYRITAAGRRELSRHLDEVRRLSAWAASAGVA
jgi:DNA-binding PadR family transcriptional regulator